MRLDFSLGPRKVIQIRRAYDSMDFLGDAGGIFGSMVLLGSAIHYFLSQNEQALHFLKSHFFIDDQLPTQSQVENSSQTSPPLNRLSFGLFDRLLLSTCCHRIYCCLIPFQSQRRNKLEKYMAAADLTVDKTLDVRRLFRIERLLSGLSRIVLD